VLTAKFSLVAGLSEVIYITHTQWQQQYSLIIPTTVKHWAATAAQSIRFQNRSVWKTANNLRKEHKYMR